MDYHQSVAEGHPNLVLKFAYLKYLYDVDPFNISVVEKGKESEQVKGRVYVTAVITYKIPFMVNIQPGTVSLDLLGWLVCNTIFLWMFLQTVKASIMTENKYLVGGFLGYQLKL